MELDLSFLDEFTLNHGKVLFIYSSTLQWNPVCHNSVKQIFHEIRGIRQWNFGIQLAEDFIVYIHLPLITSPLEDKVMRILLRNLLFLH